jgi:hypothetical protein
MINFVYCNISICHDPNFQSPVCDRRKMTMRAR